MTTDLTTALNELAQAPAPPSSINAARARAVGRQRLRRRKTAWMAGIITVALAAALTPAALPERDANPAGELPAIDHDRSPLVANGKFGWLPPYVKGIGYREGYHGDFTEARGDRDEPPVFAPRILLRVYPRGTTPPMDNFPSGAPRLRVPAPAVNGRTAYWVTADAADPLNSGDIYLRWQATRDQWAEIHAYYLPDTARQDVHRIAATASIGDHAVPLPLYITGLPTELKPIDVGIARPSLMPKNLPWDVELLFQTNGSDGPVVSISVSPTSPTVTRWGGPCPTVNGLDLCIDASYGVPPALEAIGGVAGLRSRITLLGTDESNWTTDVLR